MKKFFSLAALCALIVSCNNSGANEDAIPVLPNEEHAIEIIVDEGQAVNSTPIVEKDEQSVELKKLELLPNGSWVAEGQVKLFAGAPIRPYGTPKPVILTGLYTFANDIYTLIGDIQATIKIREDGKMEFQVKGGSLVISGCSHNPIHVNSDNERALFRKWRITSIRGKAKGASFGYSDNKEPNPNDIPAVIADIKIMAPEVDFSEAEEKVAGYYLDYISLSPNKTIFVKFSSTKYGIEKESIKGSLPELDLKNNTFSYKFDKELDGKLFEGEAKGSYSFENHNKNLVIKINAKAGNEIAEVTIKAKRID